VPLVVWGGQLPQQIYTSVGGDNQLGGLLATRHLLALGCRHIAFVGEARLPEVQLRRQGYVQALGEAGMAVDPQLELSVPFDVIAARRAMDGLFASGLRFDAVLGCSDLLALQAVAALCAAGRQVPDDVAVVGYDDMPLATCCDPPLTSVHQPVALAGAELVDALLALLRGEAVPQRTLPVPMVTRASAPAARQRGCWRMI